MTLSHPGLGPQWALRVSDHHARIHRRSDNQVVAALAPLEALLVGLMNGRRSTRSLREHFSRALGPKSLPQVDQTLLRLSPLLGEKFSPADSPPLADLGSVIEPDETEGIRLLPGPRVLHWHVTQYCPRRCVYCYADPKHGKRAVDAAISRERLAEIFCEASSLGATTLLVSGAEPFLRHDLPEVLGSAVAAGLTILLTTKHPISASIARRLADAQVPHLSFSLDAVQRGDNVQLIGSSTYAEQVRKSMRALRTRGVAFSVQTVVTRINTTSPLAVAALAEDEGAQVMQLIPFKPVRIPIATLSNEHLQLEDDSIVDSLAADLSARHPNLKIERFREAGTNGGFHCDIGQTKLLFLPDGFVHRCYKLTHDERLRGKDLRVTSVASAWHDPAFTDAIYPSRSDYGGTPCATCGKFGTCGRSGRCIYDALVHHGRYTAPDRDCMGRASQGKTIPIRPLQ
jgi:radical SAM protein with 4Fe4S-binding SPASM domain